MRQVGRKTKNNEVVILLIVIVVMFMWKETRRTPEEELKLSNIMSISDSQPVYTGGAANADFEVVNWFRTVDRDNSGRITATELQQALTNSDWSSFSYEACTFLIKMFSRNPDSTIGVDEFQAIIKYVRDWQGAFSRFDADRSGFIEQHEFHQALNSMGYRLSPQCASALSYRRDPRKGQRISLDDFIIISVKLQMYTEKFRMKDIQMRGEIDLKYDEFLIMVVELL